MLLRRCDSKNKTRSLLSHPFCRRSHTVVSARTEEGAMVNGGKTVMLDPGEGRRAGTSASRQPAHARARLPAPTSGIASKVVAGRSPAVCVPGQRRSVMGVLARQGRKGVLGVLLGSSMSGRGRIVDFVGPTAVQAPQKAPGWLLLRQGTHTQVTQRTLQCCSL